MFTASLKPIEEVFSFPVAMHLQELISNGEAKYLSFYFLLY